MASSESINLSLSITSELNGHVLDVRKPEMIYFMDIVFSNAPLNIIRKFILLTVTLVAPCVTLANVIKSVIFFNWDSLHARLNSHYESWSYKTKKHKEIKVYSKSV